MESEGSLPHSQLSATWPYPESDQSNPFPHPISWRCILILSSHLVLGLPSDSFSQVSPAQACIHLFSLTYVLHSQPVSIFSIWSPEYFYIENKIWSPALTVPPLFHLTPCTPTKSNLYFASSLAAALSEPDLYSLLTFHVPNLLSLFLCLGHAIGSFEVQITCIYFVTRPVFTVRCY